MFIQIEPLHEHNFRLRESCGIIEFMSYRSVQTRVKLRVPLYFFLMVHFKHFVMGSCIHFGYCECARLNVGFKDTELTYCEIREPWSVLIPANIVYVILVAVDVDVHFYVIIQYEIAAKPDHKKVGQLQKSYEMKYREVINYDGFSQTKWSKIIWRVRARYGEKILFATIIHNGSLAIYDGPKVNIGKRYKSKTNIASIIDIIEQETAKRHCIICYYI